MLVTKNVSWLPLSDRKDESPAVLHPSSITQTPTPGPLIRSGPMLYEITTETVEDPDLFEAFLDSDSDFDDNDLIFTETETERKAIDAYGSVKNGRRCQE